MVSLYVVLSLFVLSSCVTETLGSEDILDDMLDEISTMKRDMNKMKNDMDEMKSDLDEMKSDLDEIHLDIHLAPKTTIPTPPTLSPTTTTPTPPTLPPQPAACSFYTELSDAWRHIDYVNRGWFPLHCDATGSYSLYTNLAWGSWYRFTGAAGTKLPTAPAPVGPSSSQICGTTSVAWIKGGNPTIQDGIVARDVCFEHRKRIYGGCHSKTTAQVAACRDIHGDYFVYQLQPVSGCNNAYCAID